MLAYSVVFTVLRLRVSATIPSPNITIPPSEQQTLLFQTSKQNACHNYYYYIWKCQIHCSCAWTFFALLRFTMSDLQGAHEFKRDRAREIKNGKQNYYKEPLPNWLQTRDWQVQNFVYTILQSLKFFVPRPHTKKKKDKEMMNKRINRKSPLIGSRLTMWHNGHFL